MVLAVRIARGWGTEILQTVIDNLEASTWSLVWTFLCNGPKTPANARWKSFLEAPDHIPKQTLLMAGAIHERTGFWRHGDPVPPSIRPYLKFFSKVLMLGEKYPGQLTNILRGSKDKPQLDRQTDQEVVDLTRKAFTEYLEVYFDDTNFALMTVDWPDNGEDDDDVQRL